MTGSKEPGAVALRRRRLQSRRQCGILPDQSASRSSRLAHLSSQRSASLDHAIWVLVTGILLPEPPFLALCPVIFSSLYWVPCFSAPCIHLWRGERRKEQKYCLRAHLLSSGDGKIQVLQSNVDSNKQEMMCMMSLPQIAHEIACTTYLNWSFTWHSVFWFAQSAAPCCGMVLGNLSCVVPSLVNITLLRSLWGQEQSPTLPFRHCSSLTHRVPITPS